MRRSSANTWRYETENFREGRREKIEIIPLALPSPARGEGKHIETIKKIPSPSRGEDLVGGDIEIFAHLQVMEGRCAGESFSTRKSKG
jgi:hypothetical protein